jgi:septal ring factor EnvC (AmiA/AmiB activator)
LRSAPALALALLLPLAAAAQPADRLRDGDGAQRLRDAEAALARERAAAREAASEARAAAEALRRAEAEHAAALVALRRAEAEAARLATRLAEAEAARARAEAALGAHTTRLAPLLPAIQRLALFPAETLLVEPGPPAERLAALAALRTMARSLMAEARAQADAAAQAAARRQAVADEHAALAAALAAARERAAALDETAAAARAARGEAQADAAAQARRVAAAAASAADLRGLVGRLEAPARPAALAPGRFTLAWPVRGAVVDRPDADGPGLGIAAAPAARVLAPCSGRIAYAAPFRTLGPLLILDCGDGYHAVLAGLERLDAAVGQNVRPGDPLGSMPSFDPRSGRRAVLSLELRRAGRALDPEPFLSRQQDRIGG